MWPNEHEYDLLVILYVLLARCLSLDFYEKPLPPKPISVSLIWWVSFNRLANATMVTWCAYHVHMEFAVVPTRPNIIWKDACKRYIDRGGVERQQHNKQDRMEEEANHLYRRPQMTGQAREEEERMQRMSYLILVCNVFKQKISQSSPQARTSRCEGLPI